METLIATALARPLNSVLTLAMARAPVANLSRAFKALVAIVAMATGVVLEKSSSAPTFLQHCSILRD